jgi:hypothetical protein
MDRLATAGKVVAICLMFIVVSNSGAALTIEANAIHKLPRMLTYEEQLDETLAPLGLNAKDVLFVARTLTSESDRADEQRMVAWTIRNRVESRFRGDSTYTQVVLAPQQFSGWFISRARDRMLALTWSTRNRSDWDEAIEITLAVMRAPRELNPIPNINHYYSPVSMIPKGAEPFWAKNELPEVIIPGQGFDRFRFFSEID